MENEITWAKVFAQELDGLRTMFEDSLHYDTKQRCFVESSDPATFSEIMFSAETDAFITGTTLTAFGAEDRREKGTVDNLSTIPARFFLLLEIVIGL